MPAKRFRFSIHFGPQNAVNKHISVLFVFESCCAQIKPRFNPIGGTAGGTKGRAVAAFITKITQVDDLELLADPHRFSILNSNIFTVTHGSLDRKLHGFQGIRNIGSIGAYRCANIADHIALQAASSFLLR